jgi:4-nitrophenyl phosphatase
MILSDDQTERIRRTKAVLCDLDGTIYLGDAVFSWSAPFVQAIRETGRRILFFTNNSARNAAYYAAKLTSMGISCGANDVITSGDATISHLTLHHAGARVLVLGTQSFRDEVIAAGLTIVEHEDECPDAVVVAFDTSLTYDRVRAACRSIDQGAAFIATHPDLVCPDPSGPIPDCGSICAMISAATGIEPTVIGKPYRGMVDTAIDRLGVTTDAMAIVGDRIYTDMQMGFDNELTTILVLSGEADAGDVALMDRHPHIVVENVDNLTESLRANPIA